MAYVYHDARYAPCGFLIVRDGGDPYKEGDTVLVQSDWDFPGVASGLGYVPCECGFTDGTVDCEHKNVGEMIEGAREFLMAHLGELSEALDEEGGDMRRLVYMKQLEKEIAFMKEAVKAFEAHPEYATYGEMLAGELLAVRWGMANDCVLIARINEEDPRVYCQVIGSKKTGKEGGEGG